MPEILSSTVAEREAELAALQAAFDEYIQSSRELEEELDAELAKMQEKLAESTAANAALSAQLENIGPQLSSLETALTDARSKVKQEQKLRRAAEQAQDDADQRIREMEVSLKTLQQENDMLHEEVAFKENEIEETRLELDVEKQGLENELATMRAAAQGAGTVAVERSAPPAAVDDDGYVKKLEDELELVTEQLIETEKRLGECEDLLEAEKKRATRLQSDGNAQAASSEAIEALETENADLLREKSKLVEDLDLTREELVLAKEEIQLTQEELSTLEADVKMTRAELEETKTESRNRINQLQIQLKEQDINTKTSMEEAAAVVTSVQAASQENQELHEKIQLLEAALENSRKDYEGVLEELEAVNERFDEARAEALREGREVATEELRMSMESDAKHQMQQLQEKMQQLSLENSELQQKVDKTEMALASLKDSSAGAGSSALAGSEVVKQLQTQLERAREDVTKKDKEISVLAQEMEDRLAKAEKNVHAMEKELSHASSQLSEAENKIIVLQREKDASTYAIPSSPKRQGKILAKDGLPAAPSADRGRSFDREELAGMDEHKPVAHSGRRRLRSTSPTSVLRLKYRLDEETKSLNQLQGKYDDLMKQKVMTEKHMKRLEEDLRTLQKEVFGQGGDRVVGTDMTRLSSLASPKAKAIDLISDDKESRLQAVLDSKDLDLLSEELTALSKRFDAQRDYNAQLLSKMLHLQGNIQVYCRIRPMTGTEARKGNKVVTETLGETEVGCFDHRTNKWKSFAFDRVWGPDQSQPSVFQDVEPLALSVVDGFNACIFAYGQTGSGKTYTMEGLPDGNQYGISYRTIQKVFHLLKLRASQQRAAQMFVGDTSEESKEEVEFTFRIKIGMLEIYNDEIYDLLASTGKSLAEKQKQAMSAGGKASLDVKRNAEGRIEVPSLTRETVTNIEEVMDLLRKGNANRSTASTDMNEHSSRSHMVLSVDVYSGMNNTNSNKGTLFLVDLAGSERVRKSKVGGDQLKEAGHINKSLSSLGNVMEALDRKASHVPYRDSKLTYLLQDSLGGNSRTMMVVNVAPIDDSYDETVHALQFATRVRRINIGAAQRNVTSKNLEETVKALTEEMRTLTRAKERTEGQLHSLKRDNARVQEKLQNMSKNKSQARTDTKTLEMLRKNNDEMAKRWEREKKSREEQSDELDSVRKELRMLQQNFGKAKSRMKLLETQLDEKEKELTGFQQQLRNEKSAQSASALRARQAQNLGARAAQKSSALSRGSAPVASSVDDIRQKVLDLLRKYDEGKVDRIDIIMEKFKGKEELLLDKMTQRYEGDSGGSTAARKRNELALQRHQERMQKIRESKQK